ncbi:MAG: hypothetical protein HONBIEJF_02057 [Fimbriimonadaceae bacterium]|nr:hypothetical protein [Fimbriimonadaceae bacterium]
MVAHAQDDVSFQDRKGNMSMRGLKSWVVKRVNDRTIEFEGSGSPFVGIWKEQGLEFRGQTITGTATLNSAGAYRLSKATISGNVIGIRRNEKTGQTVTIRSASTSFDDQSNVAKIPGAFNLTLDDKLNDQNFKLTGTKADITLAPSEERDAYPIRALDVAGPVVMTMSGTRLQESTKKRTPFTITAKGSALDYRDSSRTLTLAGPIDIDGEDDLIAGTVGARSAVIKLDEKRQPIEISLSGSPGRTTLRRPPPKASA